MQLSKYFTEEEFLFSETAQANKIKNTWEDKTHLNNAVWLCTQYLDLFREELGILRVSSGYRNAELNRIVGGSVVSAHRMGLAADLVPRETNIYKAFDIILDILKSKNLAWDQIIFEERKNTAPWIHFGLRTGQMRKQILHSPKPKVYLPITKAPHSNLRRG